MVEQELTRNVGILVFDGVEELDFVGPLEVFGVAGMLGKDAFKVSTIGVKGRPIEAINGLRVTPDFDLDGPPNVDILVVPGGNGTRKLMTDKRVLGFIRGSAARCELVTSVYTGALVLAAARLLDGKRATTHWSALDELREFSEVVVEHRRFIKQGKIITSAGISAGIDMSLHIVGLLCGAKLKRDTAKEMEYGR